MSTADLPIAADVPLASWTTLELGGPADYFVRATDRALLVTALSHARDEQLPVHVLGGGSNLIVSDQGVRGLCLRVETRGVEVAHGAERVRVRVEAGEDWDALVARTVAEGWAGLECLSGIPGRTGATPIQNVGAYGQEVAETICSVELLDRSTLRALHWDKTQCGFGYRSSLFKSQPERYVVLAVTFELVPDGPPALRYPELARALGVVGTGATPSLPEVREAVLSLRRGKSMVLDPDDDNRRSAGSFFLNPVLAVREHQALCERAFAQGVVRKVEDVPSFAASGGMKVPAAWLIERAGLQKGQRSGHVGISSRHALALVHHGGGSSAELIAFAQQIQARVERVFGVRLAPEPVRWGFEPDPLAARRAEH